MSTHLPSVCLYWERAQQKKRPLLALRSGTKLPPTTLALMPDNSVPPHISLMPFNLMSPQLSSEGVSPNKSVCGPFKGNCLGYQQCLSSTASIPTGFNS